MYAPFFGLDQEPFSIAPDPRFLFMSERHREALAHLLYGVGGGGGFVLLTGEIGAGKTTVCRCFLEQIPPHCAVAYIFNPRLTVPELLQTVCDEFGVAVPPPAPDGEAAGVKRPIDALNAFLLRAHADGRSAVLIIDEAQSLAPEVLEQLRLLTNLETAERKLLQIILIGQPELRTMLARPDLEQLAQRVIARYHLGPLSADEAAAYIRHRLSVAGARAQMPFDAGALAAIHRLTGGVPRRINLLADRALLGAYAHQRATVDRRTVLQAGREVFGAAGATGSAAAAGRAGAPAWAAMAGGGARTLGIGAALGALLVALAGWAWWAGQAPAAPERDAALAAAPIAPAADTADVTTAAPAAGPPVEPANDAAALLAAALPGEADAWRELALRWNVAIGDGDPCIAAAQVQLICFRSATAGLPVVRQLGRPGLLALRSGGELRWAVLVGLGDSHATLQVGPQRFHLTLPALASAWRGEFATFWRAPPAWRGGIDASSNPALRGWLGEQLGAAGVPEGGPLRSRVAAYQIAQGLPPDGVPGPMTLMRMQRGAGIDEPVLEGGR